MNRMLINRCSDNFLRLLTTDINPRITLFQKNDNNTIQVLSAVENMLISQNIRCYKRSNCYT